MVQEIKISEVKTQTIYTAQATTDATTLTASDDAFLLILAMNQLTASIDRLVSSIRNT